MKIWILRYLIKLVRFVKLNTVLVVNAMHQTNNAIINSMQPVDKTM